jgi:hypothetical protein
LGKPGYILVAYEKATQLVIRSEGGYLALTIEPSVSANEVVGIARTVSGLRSP